MSTLRQQLAGLDRAAASLRDAPETAEPEPARAQVIANEIWRQLGGRRFAVMTGAKNVTWSELDGIVTLEFRLPGSGGFTKDGINRVRVRLDASDTYTVTFQRVRGTTIKNVAEVDDIYADNLRDVFERHTGLRTSL